MGRPRLLDNGVRPMGQGNARRQDQGVQPSERHVGRGGQANAMICQIRCRVPLIVAIVPCFDVGTTGGKSARRGESRSAKPKYGEMLILAAMDIDHCVVTAVSG